MSKKETELERYTRTKRLEKEALRKKEKTVITEDKKKKETRKISSQHKRIDIRNIEPENEYDTY